MGKYLDSGGLSHLIAKIKHLVGNGVQEAKDYADSLGNISYYGVADVNGTRMRAQDGLDTLGFISGTGITLTPNTQDRTLTIASNNAQPDYGALLDLFYPVGSIYMSVNDVNPSSLFGGTWERIQVGRFLVSAGGGSNSTPTTDGASDAANDGNTGWYPQGEKGGSRQVTLTAAQSGVPSHTHGVTRSIQHVNLNKYSGASYNNQFRCTSASSGGRLFYHIQYSETVTSGGNTAANASSAHENRPPYLAVYMWKRTA